MTNLTISYKRIVYTVGQKHTPQLRYAIWVHGVKMSVIWQCPQQIQVNLIIIITTMMMMIMKAFIYCIFSIWQWAHWAWKKEKQIQQVSLQTIKMKRGKKKRRKEGEATTMQLLQIFLKEKVIGLKVVTVWRDRRKAIHTWAIDKRVCQGIRKPLITFCDE